MPVSFSFYLLFDICVLEDVSHSRNSSTLSPSSALEEFVNHTAERVELLYNS